MKKLLLLLLTLAMLLTLVACADPVEPPVGGEEPGNQPEAPGDQTDPPAQTPMPEVETITIAQALELCGAEGNITADRYYILATVDSVTNPAYGAMVIKDDTGSIAVYGTYSADGSTSYGAMEDVPVRGDTVLLHCILQNYNGTKEVKNARLVWYKHDPVEVDPSEYPQTSITDARNAAAGTKVQVSGTVARITYANGHKPCGFILVDDAGASIYVYDGDAAGQLSIGNRVTIAASKAYWILSDEQHNAEKFGYKGCNQLENALLLSNDKKTDNTIAWDKVPAATVKELMDKDPSEDFTTATYKVTALVKKVPGNGFVNYYINDLDGKTGSYTYTQCNGSDFTWLDAFDGKICTVYLTVLNAKSTTAGCQWRLLPVHVVDEGFTFDKANAAEHAVTYYGLPQLQPSYSGDPALELITSVSSELLGFEDAKLSYTSSDPSVLSVKTENGKTVLHCHKTGKATLTVKGSFDGKDYSATAEIAVEISQQADADTFSDAIAAAVGDKVTVSGIVGPSLVNRSGFYLIDDTGVIAIITDADTLATLKLGHKVVLEGTRHNNTKGGSNYYGQTCLVDAKVVSNAYGSHDYADSLFVTDKTVKDFYNLDVKTDYTTTVFVLKAKVVLEETQYYSNISLSDGSTTIRLYCSSAKQYNWLKEYAGKEVTLEVAACNWNDKNYYTGCVLAVRTADGKVCNELNFSK